MFLILLNASKVIIKPKKTAITTAKKFILCTIKFGITLAFTAVSRTKKPRRNIHEAKPIENYSSFIPLLFTGWLVSHQKKV